jgi:hypothetical protein
MHWQATTGRYFGIEPQRAAILQRLQQGPATVSELMNECHAPDPRKRISELRRKGHEIDSHEVERPNGDGTVNRVRAYVLRVKDARQCEMNLDP